MLQDVLGHRLQGSPLRQGVPCSGRPTQPIVDQLQLTVDRDCAGSTDPSEMSTVRGWGSGACPMPS